MKEFDFDKPQEVARREPTLMEIVQQISLSPNAKDRVDILRQLLEMKERQEDREAKRLFIDALTDLQQKIPPIGKNGVIKDNKGGVRSRYALADDICEVVDPMMHEYGFSYTQAVVGIQDGMREYAGTLMHRSGHERTLSVFYPLDKSQFRSDAQSENSSSSYAKRQLYKAHFNIREAGIEEPQLEAINDDELKDLEIKLKDTKSNLSAFLKYFEIADLKDLRKADLSRAHEMIDRKAGTRK